RSSTRSTDPTPMWCCARATRRSSRPPRARSRTCWCGCVARRRAALEREPDMKPSRRHLLQGALAAGGLGLVDPDLSVAQGATPTPECRDGDEPTVRQDDGPYFKPNSPQRAGLVEAGTRQRTV